MLGEYTKMISLDERTEDYIEEVYIEEEHISEYANKDIDMGYMEDLEYDKATAREMYWNFQIRKFYK